MKAKLTEYGGYFGIDLEAETLSEAATLTSFGINYTKQRLRLAVAAWPEGVFRAHVVFGKRQRHTRTIPQSRAV